MLRNSLLLLASILIQVSCASDTFQSAARPSLDVTLTSPDLCRVYLLRSHQVRGKIRALRIYENEQEIGRLGPDEYLCWEHRPGRRLLSMVFEGLKLDGGDNESLFGYEAEAGEVYYFSVHLQDQTTRNKKSGSPTADRLSAEEGARLVAERKPAALR